MATKIIKPLLNCIIQLGIGLKGRRALKILLRKTNDPKSAQDQFLKSLLEEHKDTVYGKLYGFDKIKSAEDYQEKVPVVNYEDLRGYMDRIKANEADILFKGKPLYFTSTSGTAGAPKMIPISKKVKTMVDIPFSLVSAYLASSFDKDAFTEGIFQITSPAIEGILPGGLTHGSGSGQIVQNMNPLVKLKFPLPSAVSGINDIDTKYYVFLRLLIEREVSFMGTATPSTFIKFGELLQQFQEDLINEVADGTYNLPGEIDNQEVLKQLELLKPNPKRARELKEILHANGVLTPKYVWPHLKVIICWLAGGCSNYVPRVKELYGEVKFRDLGYAASEFKGSIPLRPNDATGVLMINSNFFEFVKVGEYELSSRKFLTVDQLEKGQQYYVFVSNHNGLYRYDINDIIEVRGFYNKTPEIVFVQKGKGITNLMGEKLSEQQVVIAMNEIKKDFNIEIPFYLGYANARGSVYDFYIEASEDIDIAMISKSINEKLCKLNPSYKKRMAQGLKPVVAHKVTSGAYDRFKKWRVSQGVREGQYKMRYLVDDPKFLKPLNEELLADGRIV